MPGLLPGIHATPYPAIALLTTAGWGWPGQAPP